MFSGTSKKEASASFFYVENKVTSKMVRDEIKRFIIGYLCSKYERQGLANLRLHGQNCRIVNFAQRSCPQGKIQDVLNDVFMPFCGINTQSLIGFKTN